MNLKENIRKQNLRIFIFANALMSLAFGLFGPFYLIFINKIGGSIENFGFAVGLVVLSGSITSLIVGRYSDMVGRKPFLILGGYSSALIVVSYTLINSLWALYVIQILNGVIATLFQTSEHALLADLTIKEKRGHDMGRYFAIVGIVEAFAIFVGGALAQRFGFEMIFYVISIIFVISTTILIKIKE